MGLHTASERELCDGRVIIYQRTDTMTAVWQCRIAFPGQPYIRQSLKTRNEAEAIKLATKLYEDLRYRHECGLPIRRKRFTEVLDLYLADLAQQVEHGSQKAKKLDDQRKMSRYRRIGEFTNMIADIAAHLRSVLVPVARTSTKEANHRHAPRYQVGLSGPVWIAAQSSV